MSERWAALFVPAELGVDVASDLVEVLVRENERFLRRNPGAPLLYRSGAFYREQPEYWLAVPEALLAVRTGMGLDCKSLAAWRIAELRVRGGERARGWVTKHLAPEGIVYHVRVRRGDGSIEDPSALLGMNAALARKYAATYQPSAYATYY